MWEGLLFQLWSATQPLFMYFVELPTRTAISPKSLNILIDMSLRWQNWAEKRHKELRSRSAYRCNFLSAKHLTWICMAVPEIRSNMDFFILHRTASQLFYHRITFYIIHIQEFSLAFRLAWRGERNSIAYNRGPIGRIRFCFWCDCDLLLIFQIACKLRQGHFYALQWVRKFHEPLSSLDDRKIP